MSTEPTASRTAGEKKFSDGIKERTPCCRSSSCRTILATALSVRLSFLAIIFLYTPLPPPATRLLPFNIFFLLLTTQQIDRYLCRYIDISTQEKTLQIGRSNKIWV